MAVEALAWPAAPTVVDGNDSTSYNMGCSFTVASAQSCPGVQWRVPDTPITPQAGSGITAVSLWRASDSTRLAYKEIDPSLSGGLTVNYLFDTPVAIPPGTYVAAVYTQGYSFRSGSPSGIATPSGAAVAAEGRLVEFASGPASSAPYPSGVFSAIYYLSPLITVGGSTTPFTLTATESYRVLNGFSKSAPESYRVLNAFLRTSPEAYRVLGSFTATVSEVYRILNAWSVAKPESYRVLRSWVLAIQERYSVGDVSSLPPPAVNAIAYLAGIIGTADLDGPRGIAYLDEVN